VVQSPRRLSIAQELSRIIVESREVYIALLFMRIDSEDWLVGLGGNLGGLRLKEIQLFVNSSTEM
jgi:hypothetical protein